MTMRQFLIWFVVAPLCLFGIGFGSFALVGLVQFFVRVFGG